MKELKFKLVIDSADESYEYEETSNPSQQKQKWWVYRLVCFSLICLATIVQKLFRSGIDETRNTSAQLNDFELDDLAAYEVSNILASQSEQKRYLFGTVYFFAIHTAIA